MNRLSSITAMQTAKTNGEILTGLLFVEPETDDLHSMIETCDKPLNTLAESDLCPGSAVLEKINSSNR
jgi:2-oxoglutarate ferredoxin oxidoreductase subunit beta